MEKEDITIIIKHIKNLSDDDIGCYEDEDQNGLVLVIEEGGGMLDMSFPQNWDEEISSHGIELLEDCEGILFPGDKTKTAKQIQIVLESLGFTVENKCESLNNKSEIKPQQSNGFYFQVINKASGTFYLITPKEVYDREGCLSDKSGVADKVLPAGFYELSESTYEYEGDIEKGRQLLLSIGMVEINFGLAPGEPSAKINETEEWNEEERDDDLDELLNEAKGDEPHPFDYKNVSSDKLLRHIRVMIQTDAFEEAEKIKHELHSRGITEF